jgi:hypothetical protein
MRGGDKAPVPGKAKAKLAAYALFIKMWMNRRLGMRDA